MMLEIHLHVFVTDLLRVKIDLHLPVCLYVSEASKLVEVAAEGIPRVVQCLIASANKAPSLYHIMSLVESWSGEVLIDRMDFKSLERVSWSDRMLPHIAYNVVEVTCFEHVDRVG